MRSPRVANVAYLGPGAEQGRASAAELTVWTLKPTLLRTML